jgi:HEAT repeat protein
LIDFEQDLISQIEKEKNPDIKVLIGLALYRMESEKGMQKMLELSSKDRNDRVRRMSAAIYNEYLTSNSNRSVSR